MKMLFPSSGSALGARFGHSFLGMHPGFLWIRQDKGSPSRSSADAIDRAKLCTCQQQRRVRGPQLDLYSCRGQAGCGWRVILGEKDLSRRVREVDIGSGRLSLMHLPLCPCPDDELPQKGGERMTSPPCQLGKPHPSDARMCCIALPRQLTSYDAEAGVRRVMPHESRESSDLSVMGTDKEQRCARWGRSLGLGLGHHCRDGCRGGGVTPVWAAALSPPSA